VVGGQRRRIKVPAAAGKRFVGLVLLFDSATGELISILQDGMLQQFSVGAINAIGAKYLARQMPKWWRCSAPAVRPDRKSAA
jgi:ornithine cyclodeaminase/alanine dehydrogenase-like protein (mu-crystallin family)